MAKVKDLVLGPGSDGGVLIRFTAENGKLLDVSLSPELTTQLAATLMHSATQVKELHSILQFLQIDQIQAGVLDGVPTLSYVIGMGQPVTVSVTESDVRQILDAWGKADQTAIDSSKSLH